MSVDVTSVLPGGAKAERLPRTKKVRVGDNNPTKFEWSFQKID